MPAQKVHFGQRMIVALLAFVLVVGVEARVWAALASEESAKIEAAKREGKVVLYTNSTAPSIEPLNRRFEAKYPFLKVEYFRAGAPKLLNKILAEVAAGAFRGDVIETEGLTAYLMMKKNLFAKYVSPESKIIPKGAKDPDGYWTSGSSNYKIVAYNTKLVSTGEVPKTLDDLLQPKWKGRMLMASNNYEWFGNVLKVLGEEKGIAVMKRLAGQDLHLRDGGSLIVSLLLAGEGAISIASNVDKVEEFKAKGAPLEWAGVEPVISRVHPIALSRSAQHPNAAKLYIDFVLSKEAQEMMVGGFFGISDRPDVKKPFSRPGLKLEFADLSLADQYDVITKKFDNIFLDRGR